MYINRYMVRPAKTPPVNGTKLLAQYRRALDSERHRHEVARPDKLGTDPMVYGGIRQWTSPRTSGGIPRISTRFSLSVENKQTDAGRDGQTCLARLNSQARTGTGKYFIFILYFQLTMSRFGNLTRLIRTPMTIHTYCTCTYSSTGTHVLCVPRMQQ